METSNIIASVSLFFSVVFGIYSLHIGRKLHKQQLQINEQTLSLNKRNEENERKALICANAFKTGNGGWRIRVFNNGESTARNIKMYSDDINADNSGIIIRVQNESYPLLNKGDHFDLVMVLYEGHNPSPIVKFVWDDEFGNSREREQALNLTF